MRSWLISTVDCAQTDAKLTWLHISGHCAHLITTLVLLRVTRHSINGAVFNSVSFERKLVSGVEYEPIYTRLIHELIAGVLKVVTAWVA